MSVKFSRIQKWKKIGIIALLLILPLCLFFLILHFKTDNKVIVDASNSRLNKKESLNSPYLVVLIMSNPTKSATRKTIRETWLSMSARNVKHFFVVGSKGLTAEVLQDVIAENKSHQDILILDSVAESYDSLTGKVLTAFQWLHSNFEFNFMLKCDDDSFVRIPPLVEELAKQPQNLLYWGFFKGGSSVFQKGKWKENGWFVCDTYLPYALGGGYILSSDLVTHLAISSDLLQLYKSEDVSVGLWLSPLKINRVHEVSFNVFCLIC